MTKYHRTSERPWTQGVKVEDFQRIARESVGKDRPNKDVDDWCNSVWGKPSSPGMRCPAKKRAREQEWVDKLAKADGKSRVKARRLDFAPIQGASKDAENVNKMQQPTSPTRRGLAAFGSVTNVLRTLTKQTSPREPRATDQLPTPLPSANPSRGLALENECRVVGSPVRFPSSSGSAAPGQHTPVRKQLAEAEESVSSLIVKSTLQSPIVTIPKTTCTIRTFLQDAVVLLARDTTTPRPSWRASSRTVIPHGQQVQSLDSLLIACEWSPGVLSSRWAKYGVIFVDDSDPGLHWTDATLKSLLERRTDLIRTGKTSLKPIFILGLSMLRHDVLEEESNVLEYVLCRFG